MDHLERMGIRERLEVQDRKEARETRVNRGLQDHQEVKGLSGILAFQEPMVRQGHGASRGCMGRKVMKDLEDLLGPQGQLAFRACQDPPGRRERADMLDHWVLLASMVLVARKDPLVERVLRVRLEESASLV